jgi:hypothetical protein
VRVRATSPLPSLWSDRPTNHDVPKSGTQHCNTMHAHKTLNSFPEFGPGLKNRSGAQDSFLVRPDDAFPPSPPVVPSACSLRRCLRHESRTCAGTIPQSPPSPRTGCFTSVHAFPLSALRWHLRHGQCQCSA